MNGIASSKYAPGKRLYFPYTNNHYVIIAVDNDDQTVTFVPAFHQEDATTETIADIESVDVQVLPDPKGNQR